MLFGLGRGMFSLEAGVTFLKLADIVVHRDASLAARRLLVNTEYLGYPVALKWNYIDRPLSTFYMRFGAMPVTFVGQSGTSVFDAPKSSTLAIFGIGGTTSLSERFAFVLDINGYRNLGTQSAGIPRDSLTLGLGLSYDL